MAAHALATIRVVVAMLVAVTIVLLTAALAYYQNFNFPSMFRLMPWQSPGDSKYLADIAAKADELRDFFIMQLNASITHNQAVYQPYGALRWDLPGEARWPEPLGEKLCILDLDSRPLDKPGQIFGNKTFDWNDPDKISGVSLGILQHWLYAKIHGYTYYWVHTREFADGRRGSWKKPTILRRVLQKHPTCVFVDSDAIFNHLDLPVEWLLNYWEIDRDKDVVSLAVDPDLKHNYDKHGKLYDNTGFIIAQSSPTAFDMMDDWAQCADDGGKFPNCTEWRVKSLNHPSDQGGFGNYIRYEYKDNIKELPCAEANGFPEHKTECLGTFIKHLWTGKNELLKLAIAKQIPGKFLELFHEQMLSEKERFYITEEEMLSEKWLPMPLNSVEPVDARRR